MSENGAKQDAPATEVKVVTVSEYFREHSVPRRPGAAKVFDWMLKNSRGGQEEVAVSLNALVSELGMVRKTGKQAINSLIGMGVIQRMNPEAIGQAYVYKILSTEREVKIVVAQPKPPKAEAKPKAKRKSKAQKKAEDAADLQMAVDATGEPIPDITQVA